MKARIYRLTLTYVQDLAASVWLAAASRLVELERVDMRERITEPAIQRVGVVVKDVAEREWN
jgi:hypothetical protein